MKKLFILIAFLLSISIAFAQPIGPGGIYGGGGAGTEASPVTKGWFTDLNITNAPTINGAAWTTILQPLDADLTTIAGLTVADGKVIRGSSSPAWAASTFTMADTYAKGTIPYASTANTITALAHPGAANYALTTNGTDTVAWAATHSHSDSAAQFYDATTTTNTVKIDAPTDTDGSIDAILDFSGVADADKTFTFPNVTGMVALVKNEKLASFAWDNGASAVATAGSKRCVAIPYAATIVGYTMVISGDPGAGGTILNITKDAWSDSSLPTTEIDASAPPTVADNKVASTDSTLTGWTKTVAANDIICAEVATNAVATWISLTIFGTK